MICYYFIMQSKTRKNISTISTNQRKKIGVVVIIIVGIYALSLLIPPVAAYSWYPIAVIKCGGAPIIARPPFFGVRTYLTPSDPGYTVSWLNRPGDFYCTEEAAQKDGYRPNKYN